MKEADFTPSTLSSTSMKQISSHSRSPGRSPAGAVMSLGPLVGALAVATASLVACSDRSEPPAPAIRRPAPAPAIDPATLASGARVQYTLRFTDRKHHYVDVEAVFPAGGEELIIAMAVWTPGSYLIREFSKHVETLTASTPGGDALAVAKVAKNRWRIASAGNSHVVVRYRVYSRILSVRTNFVAEDIAVLNGAPTFMAIVDASSDGDITISRSHVFDVTLELPGSWKHSVTALDPHPGGAAHRYVAADFDTLIDSPIVLGNPALHDFDIEGVPHQLANFGEGTSWDGERSARDLAILARAQIDFWQEIPYPRYIFLNVLQWDRPKGSGLEHKNSTLVVHGRWSTRKREDYRNWLGLMSHEFFHTWNIKRLRPVGLGPFDYENERYSRSLWIAEGVTSYYDNLFLRRAGLVDDKTFLELLSKEIESVQTTPGRDVQSLADSSFDSWIKFYRPDENSANTQISYYRKGAVVAFLLDVAIRRATLGQRSLDDVMRLAYQRHSGAKGFKREEFRAIASEVASQPLDDFFARNVDGTEELDYAPALEFLGLGFARESKGRGTGEPGRDPEGPEGPDDPDYHASSGGTVSPGDEADEKPGYLGATVDGAGVIQTVPRQTPAYDAGLNVDDEILAIDDHRIIPGQLDTALERLRPGDQVSILVARRDILTRIPVTLGERPEATWKLEIDTGAGQQAVRNRNRWLTGK